MNIQRTYGEHMQGGELRRARAITLLQADVMRRAAETPRYRIIGDDGDDGETWRVCDENGLEPRVGEIALTGTFYECDEVIPGVYLFLHSQPFARMLKLFGWSITTYKIIISDGVRELEYNADLEYARQNFGEDRQQDMIEFLTRYHTNIRQVAFAKK